MTDDSQRTEHRAEHTHNSSTQHPLSDGGVMADSTTQLSHSFSLQDGAAHHSERLLKTLHECEHMCHRTITILLEATDTSMRFRQIQLLRECAKTCKDTAQSLSASSPFARKKVKLCAKVCESCGNECLHFHDSHSQRCGHMCLKCANECRKFVGAA